MIVADAGAVRAAIARAVLPNAPSTSPDEAPIALGRVTLRPHQAEAVRRLRGIVTLYGGALLADAVGLGKTYVALALAREAERPLVVAPAALHDMWRRALAATGVRARLLSFETLSRRPDAATEPTPGSVAMRSPPPFDLVLVDEAHHVRNPATRRYRALARLAFGARVLLLSATPIHNHAGDLQALFALFLGARALALGDNEIAVLVVRRDRSALRDVEGTAEDADRLPLVDAPTLLALPTGEALADAILALPPAVPPSDGSDGGALLAHALVRQWASSDAALRAALRRRLARAHAIRLSLDRGVYPSRSELRAWSSHGLDQQLAFAELLAPPSTSPPATTDCDRLRDAVGQHERAVRALLAEVNGADADDARAMGLADVCERHAGQRVVAFASYAETVATLFHRLRHRVRAAALTAGGALVAGGPLSRREALARFAPVGSGARPPHESDRIDLLLTTDLLSEGVDLRDASVVVHLDLPWTPARLEQRVGRVARLGARHRRVTVYAFAPPASADAVLRIERRLRDKLRVAGRAVGLAGMILPWPTLSLTPTGQVEEGVTQHAEAVRRTLASWLDVRGAPPALFAAAQRRRHEPLVGAVRAHAVGFLAACVPSGERSSHEGDAAPLLLAALGDGLVASDDPALVRRAIDAADAAPPLAPPPDACTTALAAIEEWVARRRSLSATGVGDAATARARRRVIQRIALITRRAPQHRRASLAPLAHAARQAALAPCGAGGEWVLDQLAQAELPDDAWLRAVGAFGAAGARLADPSAPSAELRVAALLLLVAAG